MKKTNKTNKTVKALHRSMTDAAHKARIEEFVDLMKRGAAALAERLDIGDSDVAYGLARVACDLSAELNSQPTVLLALRDSWPGYGEILAKQYEDMILEAARGDSAPDTVQKILTLRDELEHADPARTYEIGKCLAELGGNELLMATAYCVWFKYGDEAVTRVGRQWEDIGGFGPWLRTERHEP